MYLSQATQQNSTQLRIPEAHDTTSASYADNIHPIHQFPQLNPMYRMWNVPTWLDLPYGGFNVGF